jgi:DNA-binding transcriptional LysR family regulator
MDRLAALRLFVQVVERGNISAAARALGLSTTAASRALQELEHELGVRLLDRTTRHVAATESGRHFFTRLGTLLDELEIVVREVRERHDQPMGVLRIVARRSFALRHLAPALAAFRARYPKVEVDLTLTEEVDLAPTHGTDLVIRLGRPEEKSLLARRLASGRRVLCASPQYLRQSPPLRTPDDLNHHVCLCYRRELEPSLWIFEAKDGSRVEKAVSGPLRSNSGEVLLTAAVAGMGVALLPAWMVGEDLAAGRLSACLDGWRAHPAGYRAEIYVVFARSEFVAAKITAFVEHLEEHLRGLAEA